MRATRNILLFVSVVYLTGLLLVLVKVSSGYEGGDLMTEHYRGVLQFIFN